MLFFVPYNLWLFLLAFATLYKRGVRSSLETSKGIGKSSFPPIIFWLVMSSDSNEKPFSSSKCMLLKPEKMGFFQLFMVLFGRDLNKKDFVHCLDPIIEPRFYHKWLIFVSLLVQKVLNSCARILKCIGDIFESILNPQASSNKNFFIIVFNCIRGLLFSFLCADVYVFFYRYYFVYY